MKEGRREGKEGVAKVQRRNEEITNNSKQEIKLSKQGTK